MSDAVQVKLKQIFKRCCPREGDQHVEISSVENALRKMNLMADSEAKVSPEKTTEPLTFRFLINVPAATEPVSWSYRLFGLRFFPSSGSNPVSS